MGKGERFMETPLGLSGFASYFSQRIELNPISSRIWEECVAIELIDLSYQYWWCLCQAWHVGGLSEKGLRGTWL